MFFTLGSLITNFNLCNEAEAEPPILSKRMQHLKQVVEK